MRTFQSFMVATILMTSTVITTSHNANSKEKVRLLDANCKPIVATGCASANHESTATTQTCCQPVAASIQPQIELIAYMRPAAPRRLSPQPDALEIQRSAADIACAQFAIGEFEEFTIYQAVLCSDRSAVQIYGNNLGPLPGDCANPNGACVEFGGGEIGKGVRLAQKHKPGQEFRTEPDAQATGPHKLKERTRIGQPQYFRIAASDRTSGAIVLELQRYFVRGTGKTSQEVTGAVAFGVEVDAAPSGVVAKEIDHEQIHVVADHFARLKTGNVTYSFVTATSLTQR